MGGYPGQRCITTMDGVNDYLQLGHATNLEFSQAHITNIGFTITGWIWLPGIGLENQSMPWVNIGRENTSNYYGIQCNLSLGRPQVSVMGLNSGYAGGGGNNRRTCKTNTALTRNIWNHVAWVVKGFSVSDFASNTKIYVNGVSQALTFTGLNAALTVNYSGNSFIGMNGNSSPGYIIPSTLGDITVHAKELSASVISNVYASNNDGIDWMVPVGAYTAADALTLKSWWQMGSPTGPATYPVIYDEMLLAGGTGYNATMVNMTSSDLFPAGLWG